MKLIEDYNTGTNMLIINVFNTNMIMRYTAVRILASASQITIYLLSFRKRADEVVYIKPVEYIILE